MRTYVQEGKVLSVEATDTVAAGDFVKVGDLKGFAQNDAVIGQAVAVVTEGVFEAEVAAAADIAAGDPIYFGGDVDVNVGLTTAADDGQDPAAPFVKVGFATEAATALAGVATVNVKLV
jgi:predicted RecA/RadA family phage recombinase